MIQQGFRGIMTVRSKGSGQVMCNLSQGIKDAENVKIIMNMHKIGYTSEQIAEVVEKSIAEVASVIKKREPVLA